MRKLMLLLILTSRAAMAITIGAGPAIGTDKRGIVWYEEFQDWAASDVRALDVNNDQFKLNDQYDPGRDIIAFYSHDGGADGNYYFRIDFFDLLYQAETGNLDVYLLIDCATGGTTALPDGVVGTANRSWDIAIKLYDPVNSDVVTSAGSSVKAGNWIGSYWRADLDSVEFGIKRQVLLNAGWDGVSPIYFQPLTAKDFNTTLIDTITPAVRSDATVNRAKYAAIAHANQSLGTRSQTQGHIYAARPDLNLYPGFIRAIDTAEMLQAPLNMHISGSLLSSFLWARSADPTVDGPAFLQRLKNFINSGTGSLIGGVYAEHIMPYFEGEPNRASIRAFNDLAESIFGLTTNDMKVMHVPERVIHSNTNWAHANPAGPLKGKPFDDITAGGYTATYLDEISHLHWWFYPSETNSFVNACGCAKWAGFGGCEDRPYHHKLHKINGVLTFMINDREDQSKFGNDDGGMLKDTRYTLLDKALSPDYAQITIVFDDWEAYAGNCFTCSQPVNNADQWHNTIRWAANHQWIQIVNLKDVVTWAQSDTNWIYADHGTVITGKTSQTYEWLKHASEHSYDNWYYGSALEQSFFDRVPPTAPSGFTIPGTKKYGDMNTTNTLFRDSWDKVAAMPAGKMKSLAEWTYSAMIYETAWHDEVQPAWWVGGGWDNSYKSRNYQVTFDRHDACTDAWSDDSYDVTSGWALRLHGHARKVGILADAANWAQQIKNSQRGPVTEVWVGDLDDDKWDEYVLKNNRVYLCFKRWGARLLYAFVYDPVSQEAIQVIGSPVANPSEEHDGEGADNNRCSAFKDRWNTWYSDARYVDLDYASPTRPVISSKSITFVSGEGDGGRINKKITLPSGRDAVRAEYSLSGPGTLYVRHGFGPNQFDLLKHGDTNLTTSSAALYYGLQNSQGGAVFAVNGSNCSRSAGSLANAGYQNRELPLVEQVEQFNTVSGSFAFFSTWLTFSLASAQDVDGDGLSNTQEQSLGSDYENPDTDGDGMSDGFEYQYFGTPTGAVAGNDDDGDGQSNLAEAMAGTNPVDANSAFRILNVTRLLNGDAQITASSVAGLKYVLLATSNLAAPFAAVSTTNTASGPTIMFTDPASGANNKSYKVQIIP